MVTTSSGWAKRPIGEFARKKPRISGSSNQCFVIGVSTNPGASALMRIPWAAYSIAAAFDKPMTACFAATLGANATLPDHSGNRGVVDNRAAASLQHLL